jgi:hypothetical protein
MHENILDVVFGIDHIIAEFFWNAVFAVVIFVVSKAKAKRSLHKYIDNKHGIKHDNGEY